jgi:CHAD domain-containing protein
VAHHQEIHALLLPSRGPHVHSRRGLLAAPRTATFRPGTPRGAPPAATGSAKLWGVKVGDRELLLPAEEGARALAAGLLEEARLAADGLAVGAGEEALHDFRVALRRLRSALRAFRPWLAGAVRRKDERRLRRMARSTSAQRDAEVQLAWLAARRGALAASRLRAGLDLAVARLEERARRGPEGTRVADRYRRAAGRLARRLRTRGGGAEADAGKPFGRVLASLVRDEVAALRERMGAIGSAADEEAVHRARIEGKRLRYLLEPLRGCGPADATEAVGRLKRLQDVLGELHDAHVLAAELREALVEAAADQARRIHAAVYVSGATTARGALRSGPRPGIVALLRLVAGRRDALHAELERERRDGGVEALAAEATAVAAALEGRGVSEPAVAGERRRAPPARARRRARRRRSG